MNGRGRGKNNHKGRGRGDTSAATGTAAATTDQLLFTVYGGRKGNCNYYKQPGHYKNECKELYGDAAEPLQTPKHPSKNKVCFYPKENYPKK